MQKLIRNYILNDIGAYLTKRVLAIPLTIVIILLVELLPLDLVDANPTWGKPATPIPPIKDPPQIIIDSPSQQEYKNPVTLEITIVQPDSWVSKNSFVLPNGWVDNSDSVVVGQNTLTSLTCVVDGQSITLWKGTPVGYGITYYLPKVAHFSAVLNLSKGQHDLQVNVLAKSEYVTEGIMPFAQGTYLISANQSKTFSVSDSSEPTMIYDMRSSYVIWQSSSIFMPSPTLGPSQLLVASENRTTASFIPVVISPKNQTTYGTEVPLIYMISTDVLWSYYSVDIGHDNPALKVFNGNITLSNLTEGRHELLLSITTKTYADSDQPHSTHQRIIFYVNANQSLTTETSDPSVYPTQVSEFPLALGVVILVMVAVGFTARRLVKVPS